MIKRSVITLAALALTAPAAGQDILDDYLNAPQAPMPQASLECYTSNVELMGGPDAVMRHMFDEQPITLSIDVMAEGGLYVNNMRSGVYKVAREHGRVRAIMADDTSIGAMMMGFGGFADSMPSEIDPQSKQPEAPLKEGDGVVIVDLRENTLILGAIENGAIANQQMIQCY